MRIFDATLATLERSLDVRLERQNVLGGARLSLRMMLVKFPRAVWLGVLVCSTNSQTLPTICRAP